MNGPQREMTIEEYVDQLPLGHRAREEFGKLVGANRMMAVNKAPMSSAEVRRPAGPEDEIEQVSFDLAFQFSFVLTKLANLVHSNAKAKGFWWEGKGRNRGEMIALMHSELSEALEAVRGPRENDEHCPEFLSEEIELADCIIRILDYSAGFKIRLAEAILAKISYNNGRPYKHEKNF